MECQRIFGRWKFWVIAALALGMNVFLFIRTQERTYGRIAGAYECTAGDLFAEYRRQLGEYTEINGETRFCGVWTVWNERNSKSQKTVHWSTM